MNLFDLSGKVAVVTGGNSGIGRGMAMGLAEAGATVVIAARDDEKSQRVAAEIEAASGRALPVHVDVTDAVAISKMVDQVLSELGRIDILINNAGTNIRQLPQDTEIEAWRTVIETNLTSALLCSQAVYPAMKAAGGGKIINNGSMASIFGFAQGVAYAAAKGGVVQLTKSLAVAWAEDNIQVNCLLPGWVDTPLTIGARRDIPGLHDKVVARCPAGRWGTTEDFAGIAVFLAGAGSDYITGTAIPVDGGYSCAI